MASLESVLEWRGLDMVDPDGDKIGSIEEIYVDQETDQPEWALVNTGMFGSKSTFVPITEGREDGGRVLVPFEKSRVKDAPNMDPSGELTRDEEAQLYRHYGMEYGQSESQTGMPEDGGDAERGSDRDLSDRAETRGGDPDRRERVVVSSERDPDPPVRDSRDRDDRDRESGIVSARRLSRSSPPGERVRMADDSPSPSPSRPRLRRYVVTEVVTASGTQEVEREQIAEAELPDESDRRRRE